MKQYVLERYYMELEQELNEQELNEQELNEELNKGSEINNDTTDDFLDF
jgi:hypothetical protein